MGHYIYIILLCLEIVGRERPKILIMIFFCPNRYTHTLHIRGGGCRVVSSTSIILEHDNSEFAESIYY